MTNGHVDIIERGARLFDRIIVAILVNAEKAPLFTMAERVDIARKVFKDHANVEVDTFDGLLVDYVAKRHANVLVRGLRAVSDFEFEFQMALMNRHLNPAIETVFMMPDEKYSVHQLPPDQGSLCARWAGARAGAGTGGNTPAGEAGHSYVARPFQGRGGGAESPALHATEVIDGAVGGTDLTNCDVSDDGRRRDGGQAAALGR